MISALKEIETVNWLLFVTLLFSLLF